MDVTAEGYGLMPGGWVGNAWGLGWQDSGKKQGACQLMLPGLDENDPASERKELDYWPKQKLSPNPFLKLAAHLEMF